ncbi:MAG TPA: ABC transporter permease [Bacteroidales bacterium]|nr:ABC transporter permease [Bacteroidales bacterium]
MFKFISAVKKEYLLLLRDKAGIIILFIMPMMLIVIMSLLQEVGWNAIAKEPKVEVLFVNNDGDSLGINMEKGLRSSGFFDVIDSVDHASVTAESARAAVKKGDYLIAIVVPKGVTKSMRANVRIAVAKTLSGFGMFNPMLLNNIAQKGADTVTLYFDPTIRKSFKNAVVSSIKEFNYRSETGMVFRSFNSEMSKQFPAYKPADIEYKESLQFKEVFPNYKEQEEIPNTVQHNVPAWAIFAMFFIIIPLTGSMIKEREEGSLARLMSMPVSYIHLLLAKVTVYFFVCMVQSFLMIFSGIFILPLFHIPMLVVENHIIALTLMTIATALAALGYGLLVGTIANTHQQAAAFGAVSIIILAAIGGIWVPIYLMPTVMRHVAVISPLNWGITGFYNIFLRQGGLITILSPAIKLLAFFLGSVLITYIYRKIKSPLNI